MTWAPPRRAAPYRVASRSTRPISSAWRAIPGIIAVAGTSRFSWTSRATTAVEAGSRCGRRSMGIGGSSVGGVGSRGCGDGGHGWLQAESFEAVALDGVVAQDPVDLRLGQRGVDRQLFEVLQRVPPVRVAVRVVDLEHRLARDQRVAVAEADDVVDQAAPALRAIF